MVEYIMNPLIALYIVGSFTFGSLFGINPGEQRARASATTAKSTVATICRAQALCMVDHYEINECTSFGSESVDMPEPDSADWTYTFGSPTTEEGKIIGTGNLYGETITMTCSNNSTSEARGKVICSDSTESNNLCKEFNL